MQQEEDKWPENIPVMASSESAKEEKKDVTFMVQELAMVEDFRLKPERFSSMLRLKRVTAWVNRFVYNSLGRQTVTDPQLRGELSVEELQDVETSYLLMAQKDEYGEEIRLLKQGKTLAPKSTLLPLQPFLDEDGLLRANSRLQHAEYLPYEAKNPAILPRRHWITRLLVRSYHAKDGHAMGTNHTLALLSEKFWIPQARELIREVEHSCNHCIRRKAKAAAQIMAPLPESRVGGPLRAFSKTSVDYAGPFEAIQGRGRARAKRYLCLFTCMLCRAVHLEIAYSLDTDSFLNAFQRMVARRGLPEEVHSDNGTNFVGANNELQDLVKALDKDKITRSTADKGVKWYFNPPYAPHFGGVHEIMVKAAKRAIYAILGKADINDEELITAFVGSEDLINSRPITYQTANPEDNMPPTPNHFLQGRAGGMFAPSSVDTENFSAQMRWRRVQELIRHFWERWMKEWIPSLSHRKKWFTAQRNLDVGDLVLLIETDTPRGQWSLGRIIKTYNGTDDKVRTVDLEIRGRRLKRSVHKLCPLEFSDT